MSKKKPAPEPAEPRIVTVRGQRVILDSDLAEMYGLEARVLNQAVKRNAARFPEDFAFQLTVKEADGLRSQPVTLDEGQIHRRPEPGRPNSSQPVMSSRRGRSYLPWAFTEHGALMAANVLRSTRAVELSVYVVRAFIRMREQLMVDAQVLKRLAEIDRSLLEHDQSLQFLWRQIEPLLHPPDPPRPKIGFHR